MKVLAEGAEAVVYETELDGVPALLKRRIAKRYRVEAMDTKIRRMRSKNEARIIAMVSKAGINAPRLLLFDKYDIYMTKVNGKKLAEVMDSKTPAGRIFEKIGRMLARMHEAGIAHGDYTPANIIVGKEGPFVIDFGLSELTHSLEEQALDVLLMKRSITDGCYRHFLTGYNIGNATAKDVMKRLEVIEKRGRYQTRTLA